MKRILIADDHAIIREGLKQILLRDADIVVAAEASSGPEVLERVAEHALDVVVLDISMPGGNGIEILPRIRRLKPQLPVLILSMHPERDYAVRALRAGASGYLTKTASPEELIGAIKKVANGGRYVTEALVEVLAQILAGDLEERPEDRLSNREYEVFRRIASGETVTEIAGSLSLSVKTVSTNRSRILKKMAMRNNAELMRYAIERGLTN